MLGVVISFSETSFSETSFSETSFSETSFSETSAVFICVVGATS
ncbi:hypothetical protein HW054_000314 [Campylobacter lari]|nr:hypothetical protein [Campylobacter lari]EFS7934834.1 hypothetical protein [Campylobacter lari]